MKQYYIYLDNEQKGPYPLEEIIKQIKVDTLVWHEGMQDWQRADTIEEFKIHFKSVPPLIKVDKLNQISAIPVIIDNDNEYSVPRILGVRRKLILYVILGIGLFIGIVVFTNYTTEQRIINYETERQFLEQHRIATEKRIKEINEQLLVAYHNLEQSKRSLHDATAFQLFRSNRKRNKEINNVENNVKSWTDQINNLEREMRVINPGWVSDK